MRAFRKQLEDKKAIIETNLLSGRQYIANEPPLSDTSDSEGNVLVLMLTENTVQYVQVIEFGRILKALTVDALWFHVVSSY